MNRPARCSPYIGLYSRRCPDLTRLRTFPVGCLVSGLPFDHVGPRARRGGVDVTGQDQGLNASPMGLRRCLAPKSVQEPSSRSLITGPLLGL